MTKTEPLAGWPLEQSPFHPAELALQEQFGRRQQLDAGARRGVRDHLIDQHRVFFARLPFVLIGSVDREGQPWASMVAGLPGFAHSPDPSVLRIEGRPLPGDPLTEHLVSGAPIGVLGIELPTRRRNRMNGRVSVADAGGFSLRVVQSYGNCPQYIQGRKLRFLADGVRTVVEDAKQLDERDRAMLAGADTFYIASINPGGPEDASAGADVSHRGGRPGFIRVDDNRTITTPDFVGNYFFNTIGNLVVEPRAGLLFADFESGDVTMMAARSEIIWQGPDVDAFAGAQRLIRFHIERVVRLTGALPFRADGATDFSREIAATGTWAEAEQSKAASRDQARWRPFRIAQTYDESRSIRSFVLEPDDNEGVAPHRAGQFLPIRVPAGEGGAFLVRTYTLSDVANGRTYRISVRRDGVVSTWLHSQAESGGMIEALPPRGEFVFDQESRRPALLVSAGVGVTPMVAMLNSLLVNNMRTRHAASIIWLQAARSGAELAFADHVRHKAKHHSNLSVHFAVSQAIEGNEAAAADYRTGRIDRSLLEELVPSTDADVYLCGPSGFMQSIYDALLDLGIPDRQIHFEAFGPANVARRRGVGEPLEGTGPSIGFARSGTSVTWTPSLMSLLGAADAAGVAAPYSCKSGVCGSCVARLLSGAVAYTLPPVAERDADAILLCCTVPANVDDIIIDA